MNVLREEYPMKDLMNKMADFAKKGEDARLELTHTEVRQIVNLVFEKETLATRLDTYNKAFKRINKAFKSIKHSLNKLGLG